MTDKSDHETSKHGGAPEGNQNGAGSKAGSAPEGNDFAAGNDGGAPAGNQNAQTHGLFADHDNYFNDLEDDEQAWVFDFTNDLLDRYRRHHGKEPDMFEHESLKNVAIDFHRIANANGWFAEQGLVHHETDMSGGTPTEEVKLNVWSREIRKYNESVYQRMQKHGLLDDPETQKADAIDDLSVEIEHIRVTEDNVDEFKDDE